MIRLLSFKLLQIKCTALVFRLLTVIFKIKKQPVNFLFHGVNLSTLWFCNCLSAIHYCQLPGRKFNNSMSVYHFTFYKKFTSGDVCIAFLLLDYLPYAKSLLSRFL